MEFDGYRVPNLSSGAGGGGGQSGKGDHKGAGAGVDYTWYAVLVWCGRKPSPKYCATKEDLTSSPYFQNVQVLVNGFGACLALTVVFSLVEHAPSARTSSGQHAGSSAAPSPSAPPVAAAAGALL